MGIKIKPNSNNKTRKDHDQLMMNIALACVCHISVHAQRDNLEKGGELLGVFREIPTKPKKLSYKRK